MFFYLLPKIGELESTVASASDRFFKARLFFNVMTDWKSDTSHLFGVNIPGLPRGYHPAFAEQDEDDILSKLNMKLAKESARATVIEKKKFKARFMKEVPDAVSFISSLLTIYNVGRPIVEAVLDKIS